MPLILTDEQKSMIASALIAGADCGSGFDHDVCLCCAPDALDGCALIVGPDFALALQVYFHDELGCGFGRDDDAREHPDETESREDRYLGKIAELDVLHTDAEIYGDSHASHTSHGP